MNTPRKLTAVLGTAAVAVAATLAATPAASATPPYPANCSGGQGDVNAHRYTLYNNTVMRKNNAFNSQHVAVLAKNKKLHLYYKTADENGAAMWAARAWLNGTTTCGYVYQGRVNWSKSW